MNIIFWRQFISSSRQCRFVVTAICLLAGFHGEDGRTQTVPQFTYSAKLWTPTSMADYMLIGNRESILKRAQQHEESGQVDSGKFLRSRLAAVERTLNSLPEEERAVLARIWTRASDAKLAFYFCFGVDSMGKGSESHVSAISFASDFEGLAPGEANRADAVMDDVCSFAELKHLNLFHTMVEPDSLRKLTSLKKLEYLNAPANISDEMLLMLLRGIPSLKFLELHECKRITGAFAKDKEAGRELSEVNMIGTGLEPNRLVDIITLPEVKFIGLDGMNLYVDALDKDLWRKK